MRKRPRRKRAKRSARGHDRQRAQQLSREVRELYPPGAAGSDPDAEWHAGLEEESGARPRRGGRPPPASQSAPPADDSPAAGPELRGRVVAIASGSCRIAAESRDLDGVLPSALARDQRAAVAVGDEVAFAAHGASAYRVRRVLPRRTTLSRPDPHNPRLERVIAANIDVAVHVASVVEPPLRPALIDRYLIAIDRGGAEALICVNKIDLLPDAAERRRLLERLACYRDLAPAILPTSALTGEGLDALRAHLAGKTAVFVGHSGVGKSSLLNALDPDLDAATAGVAGSRRSGRHTTTGASLYHLSGDIRVIDTPGIREFGLWQLSPEQLRAFFPDFDRHASRCRFNDCSHSHEPDCGVRAAGEAGDLPRARFETYLRILASLKTGE